MGVPHISPHVGSSATATSVCVWPSDEQVLIEAMVAAKCRIAGPEDADVLVSFNGDVELIRRWLRPGIRWVQLGSAGVDKWLDARVIDRDRMWTASQGVYAEPIAEHALALLLAAACDLPECIRVQRWSGAA